MLDWLEIVLRLGVATLAGGAIGLNRDLHGKPIGLKTLALVGLATAMILVLIDSGDVTRISDAGSRVIQGILTGIGFLGAGVIVHRGNRSQIHGLTSAAYTWLTACLGIMCGAGHWRIVIVALAITGLIIFFGATIERSLHRALRGKDNPAEKSGGPDPSADAPADLNDLQSSVAGPHQPGR
jgi:putative Mg2+ transporter-C (MgtC) family protein